MAFQLQEKGKGIKLNVQYVTELSTMTTDWKTIENTNPLYQNENKHVPYEVLGVAKNLFEAAKRKQSLQVQQKETSSASGQVVNLMTNVLM